MSKYKDIEALNHWKTVLEEYPHDEKVQGKYREQYRLIGRDNARLPMKWSSDKSTHAGFLPGDGKGEGKPWMDVHPDFEEWNAEELVKDNDSAFHYWRRILELRKKEKDLLVYGNFEMFDLNDDASRVVAYLRTDDKTGKKCLVMGNFDEKETWWTIPKSVQDVIVKDGKFNKGAVVQELRNYTADEGGNQVRQSGGEYAVRLRAWETLVLIS
jgi:glycosidase